MLILPITEKLLQLFQIFFVLPASSNFFSNSLRIIGLELGAMKAISFLPCEYWESRASSASCYMQPKTLSSISALAGDRAYNKRGPVSVFKQTGA